MDKGYNYNTLYFYIDEDVITYFRVINRSTSGRDVLIPVAYTQKASKPSDTMKSTNVKLSTHMTMFTLSTIIYKKGFDAYKVENLRDFINICEECKGKIVSFSGNQFHSDLDGWMFYESVMEVVDPEEIVL